MITVFKSKDKYRWVAISSTAYRDRDREIVSRKALQSAIAKANRNGNRGPLRFWHVKGLDIGTTDFQMLSDDGKYLIESGLIYDDDVAEALKERADGWQMSIGFRHLPNEPDRDGVFHDIDIFERSITPPNKAANQYTAFGMKDD